MKQQMKWMLRAAAIGLCVFAMGAESMTIRQFRALEKSEKSGPKFAAYYLIGAIEGEVEAARGNQRKQLQPSFCPPADLNFNLYGARALFAEEMQHTQGLYEADMPVELVVSEALRRQFPCVP